MILRDLKPGDCFEFTNQGIFPGTAKMKTKTGYVILEGRDRGHQSNLFSASEVKLLDLTITWKEKFPTK